MAELGRLQCLEEPLRCDLRILDLQVFEPSELVHLPPVLSRLDGLDRYRFHDVLQVRVDQLVWARVWAQAVVNRIENCLSIRRPFLTAAHQRPICT